MSLQEIITLARKHLESHPNSSAELCLRDAERHMAEVNPLRALTCAVNSLRYSVGISHHDYKAAQDAATHGRVTGLEARLA